jgi:uncharacterized protein
VIDVTSEPAEVHELDEEAAGNTRRCLVTGRRLPRERLIRFVVDPDGMVVPDVDERLPGRGLWLVADRDTLTAAVERRLFARAARRAVQVPDDLVGRVERLLRQRCQSLVGLALRAGQAAFGFEKVREWLLGGRGVLLIEATDGAPGECRKLRGVAPGLPVLRVLLAEELAVATGRGRTVHGVIAAAPLAARLMREAARLAGLRMAGDNTDSVRPFRAVHST